MKNLLLVLAFLLVSCGSDSDSVSPYGPETLIGEWEMQKLEYRSYFAIASMPGEQSRVIELTEPVVFEAPTVSGTVSFDGAIVSITIMMTHIKLMSSSHQYIAENGVIAIALSQTQSLNWGYDFSGGNLILYIPDLPGSDILETKLYYKKK